MAAYLSFDEGNRGTLETGKLADLVVLDRDYLTCSVDEIKDIKPVMTVVAGKAVFER
jgi:predicted amidohydrolase YtcJ